MSSKKTVLFIGGTGKISWWCADAAVKAGHEVFILNRGQTGIRPAPEGTRLLRGNARDPQSVRAAVEGMDFDSVVNFVAYMADDVKADIELFRGRTGQYVFISSASAYQTPPRRLPVTESTPLQNPFWAYSRNKTEAEDVLVAAYRSEAFLITIVRPSHTYDHGSIPLSGQWTSIERMRQGKPVLVHGDGTSLWTITHARDFAKGFTGLICNPLAYGDSFHITSDDAQSWNAILLTIADAAGVKTPEIVHVTSDQIAAMDAVWGESLLGDMSHSMVFDNAKIKALVPAFVCTTPLHEGVRESIAFLDANPQHRIVDKAKDEAMDWLIETYRPRSR